MNYIFSSKRLLLILGMLLLGLLSLVGQIQAAPVTQTSPTAVIDTGALNVRSGPSVAYGVVSVVYQGNSVTLLGRNSNSSWVQIRTSSNVTGWVNASLLATNTNISALPIVATPAASAAALVSTGALNVRSGPGVNYSVLTVASFGQSVALLGRHSDNVWVKIQMANGQQGWVNSSLLTSNVAISSLPLADAPAQPVPSVPVAPNAILTLRAGPSFNQPVVGSVFQGQRVKAIARNDNNSWVKVRITETGVEGWILASNVQLSFPIGNLPIQFGSGTPTTPTPTPAPAPTSPTGVTAVVATGSLNVRSGPGVAYSILTAVNQGTTLAVTGRNAAYSWVQVTTPNNLTGWVSAGLVNINGDTTSLPIVDVPTQTATATINTGALNVRSGPSINNGVTAVVTQGTVVGLIGRNSDTSWVQVRLNNGHVGWINATYILSTTTLNSLPITE